MLQRRRKQRHQHGKTVTVDRGHDRDELVDDVRLLLLVAPASAGRRRAERACDRSRYDAVRRNRTAPAPIADGDRPDRRSVLVGAVAVDFGKFEKFDQRRAALECRHRIRPPADRQQPSRGDQGAKRKCQRGEPSRAASRLRLLGRRLQTRRRSVRSIRAMRFEQTEIAFDHALPRIFAAMARANARQPAAQARPQALCRWRRSSPRRRAARQRRPAPLPSARSTSRSTARSATTIGMPPMRGLDGGQPERLPGRRKHEQVRGGVEIGDIVGWQRTEHMQPVVDAERDGKRVELRRPSGRRRRGRDALAAGRRARE